MQVEPKNDTKTERPNQNGKPDKKEPQSSKKEPNTPQKSGQNGNVITKTAVVHVTDVTLNSNGSAENVLNGTSVSEEADEDALVVVVDDNDDLFPELKYDENTDESGRDSVDSVPSRSKTRRSKVPPTWYRYTAIL